MQREVSPASVVSTATRPKSVSSARGPPAPAPRPAFNPVGLALKKLTLAGVLFVVVFFACALWLFGSLYENSHHVHKFGVVVVDFDGGSVGNALLGAVNAVNGQDSLPTFHILAANSTSRDEVLHKVWQGRYWGSIIATEGASSRFEAAVASADAASTYDAAQALEYSGLEVRYTTAWSGAVLPALLQVSQTASARFSAAVVAPLLESGTSYSAASAQVLVRPVAATFVNQTPFTYGTRIVLNTIAFVLPFLLQFFFLLAWNNIFLGIGVYRNMSFARHLKYRLAISLAWTLLTSLMSTTWGVMFDEGYDLAAKQFFALWTVHWVFSMITFDTLDIVTTWVPLPFVSYFVVSLIVTSVSAIIWPYELSNAFYRIHVIFPSHAAWSIIMTILGRGAVNTLSRDAPILAAWLVVLKAGVLLSLRRRARQGLVLVDVEDKAPTGGQGGAPQGQLAVEKV
ncbi:uncharacterized protein RHOBADRAFT_55040 [Rhodotorula graminis WP1]|uniref:DUF3533 domain-containing protein n=1 Tax=Rhodotorula graminis (strain WP1) TaxID=578459 RepID=A0A0P9EIP1_RHOGW|nr:uncharacterized protein RHOBADRAFT_55040 [Rhodotorula graminis WP1]KPV73272.1 hypothetical protein RHOBADRAFT_55040 [Rhodotorula graminis WP1]